MGEYDILTRIGQFFLGFIFWVLGSALIVGASDLIFNWSGKK